MDQQADSSSSSWDPYPAASRRHKTPDGDHDVVHRAAGHSAGVSQPGLHELVAHLRHLYADLSAVIQRDPEQEILGLALAVIDQVMSAAARLLQCQGSVLAGVATELISPATIEAGEPVRAVDAWLVVGQLLAALGDPPAPMSPPAERTATAAVGVSE